MEQIWGNYPSEIEYYEHENDVCFYFTSSRIALDDVLRFSMYRKSTRFDAIYPHILF